MVQAAESEYRAALTAAAAAGFAALSVRAASAAWVAGTEGVGPAAEPVPDNAKANSTRDRDTGERERSHTAQHQVRSCNRPEFWLAASVQLTAKISAAIMMPESLSFTSPSKL